MSNLQAEVARLNEEVKRLTAALEGRQSVIGGMMMEKYAQPRQAVAAAILSLRPDPCQYGIHSQQMAFAAGHKLAREAAARLVAVSGPVNVVGGSIADDETFSELLYEYCDLIVKESSPTAFDMYAKRRAAAEKAMYAYLDNLLGAAKQPQDGLRAGVRQIAETLAANEWAELLSTDPDLAALEAQISRLVGRTSAVPAEPASQQDAGARDAARYRWLRAAGSIVASSTGKGVAMPMYEPTAQHLVELDAAIDAAIAQQKNGGN